ncbi:MAG: potassium channel protein [Planctomycetota bacterium]
MAERFAPVMFLISILFLILIATLVVVWVDIPRFELIQGTVQNEEAFVDIPKNTISETANRIGSLIVYVLVVLWVIVVGEVLLQLSLSIGKTEVTNVFGWRVFAVFQCLCPPLRLAAPNIAKRGNIWLPIIGWAKPSRKLFRRLETAFSKPMLFFALLILPILLIEFGLHSLVESQLWLRLTIHFCTGLIWCAFAVEFIVLVSASKNKLAYVKKNWIDLAIVLLPIVLFLRSLRAVRLARLAKFAKVQQLVNMSRIYRVRGVAMKAVRALMLFEVFGRIMGGSPERRLRKLQAEFDEKREELDELAAEISKVEASIAAQKETQEINQTDRLK